MTLYDENNNPVSLDLESVQNAIDTLKTLSENYDDGDYVELTEADDIITCYENYLSVVEACELLNEASEMTYFEEKSKGFEFGQLSDDKNMRDVLKNFNANTRELSKRYRRFLKENKFDEAQKVIDECQRILNDCKSEIKKMPASKICNLYYLIIPIATSIAAFVSVPIVKKNIGYTSKGLIKVGAGAGALAGGVTLLSSLATWRKKVKEINTKENTGEEVSKEMNWAKVTILNILDNYQKQLTNCTAHIRKVNSKYGAKLTKDDARSIVQRINQIDNAITKSLKYDPARANKLKAEKRELQARLRELRR